MSTGMWHRVEDWLKEGWRELKTVSLIFLGIVFFGSILLMTPLPKAVILWSSFVAAILLPVLMLPWEESRKKQPGEVKLNESSTALLHGQDMYIHMGIEGNNLAKNLPQPLVCSNLAMVYAADLKFIKAALITVPSIGFYKALQGVSGRGGTVKVTIPAGALSGPEHMTASAQLPAQRFLEATYPRSAGGTSAMKLPILSPTD